MKKISLFLLAAFVLAGASLAVAGETETVVEKKVVIALKTDDFVIEETDLSHLSVGDAETIVTESGKTVDLLRTEDGIEIYVDGELLDTGDLHGGKHLVRRIEIECDGDDAEDCANFTAIGDLEGFEVERIHEGDNKFIIIQGEDEEWDVEMLPDGAHEVHGTVHIVKEFDPENPEALDEFHELHELHSDGEHEVIIIEKIVEEEI